MNDIQEECFKIMQSAIRAALLNEKVLSDLLVREKYEFYCNTRSVSQEDAEKMEAMLEKLGFPIQP